MVQLAIEKAAPIGNFWKAVKRGVFNDGDNQSKPPNSKPPTRGNPNLQSKLPIQEKQIQRTTTRGQRRKNSLFWGSPVPASLFRMVNRQALWPLRAASGRFGPAWGFGKGSQEAPPKDNKRVLVWLPLKGKPGDHFRSRVSELRGMDDRSGQVKLQFFTKGQALA